MGYQDILHISSRYRNPDIGSRKRLSDEGRSHFENGEYEQAASKFSEALSIEESCDLWMDWGVSQLACQDIASAEKGFKRALELDSANSEAAVKLGIVYAELGRLQEATSYLEKGLPSPNSPDYELVNQLLTRCKAELPSGVLLQDAR
jgi:Flp pilus assembly protein TadD